MEGHADFGEADARFGAPRGGTPTRVRTCSSAGTPIRSTREGLVVEKGDDGGRGNYVAIWNARARRTFVYLHMLGPLRGDGASVSRPARASARWAARARAGETTCTSRYDAGAAPPDRR